MKIDTEIAENLIKAYDECSKQLDEAYYGIDILARRCARLLEETKDQKEVINALWETIELAKKAIDENRIEESHRHLGSVLWAKNI